MILPDTVYGRETLRKAKGRADIGGGDWVIAS